MVERQNILSTIMLKNVKLSNENVRLQLATPEICYARNLTSNARNLTLEKDKLKTGSLWILHSLNKKTFETIKSTINVTA